MGAAAAKGSVEAIADDMAVLRNYLKKANEDDIFSGDMLSPYF